MTLQSTGCGPQNKKGSSRKIFHISEENPTACKQSSGLNISFTFIRIGHEEAVKSDAL